MADHEREINDDEGMIDGDAVIRRQSGTLTVVLGTAHETDEAMPMTPRKAEPRHAGVEMTSLNFPVFVTLRPGKTAITTNLTRSNRTAQLNQALGLTL